ncbi:MULTISPECIES: hypothetical protein [Streptomyces]|uniref:Uncharacterized protein n=1 Tax=Streptomyces canarius TaxID=285453 RepID=A0ABQ3CHZ5_9ACTN|nr:hypothetical protein [Streptomyces canarius]GHA15934.1 hypothetical protein GCM10010345_20890 [Streptomyces canarius]
MHPTLGGRGGCQWYVPAFAHELRYGRAEEASARTAHVASSMGLIRFDPQERRLRP